MRTFWTVAILIMGQSACSSLNPIDRTPSANGLGGVGGSRAGAGGSAGAAGSSAASSGLPCEIRAILVSYCDSCHGATPVGGAPRSLVSYDDLTRADLSNTSLSEAEMALQRIQSKSSPMPPSGMAGPSAAEIATLKSWVSSGFPKGSCGTGTGGAGDGGSGGASGDGAAGSNAGGVGGSAGARGGAGGAGGSGGDVGGLPCDIQALLVNRCESCHGSTPSGGAPRSLVTFANLTAPDLSNPSLTEAQVALQRMQSTTSPMPPSPASPATSSEISAMQTWINSGYPTGSCAAGGAGGSGGGGAGGSGGGSTDPLNAAPTCTSKTNWTRGTNGSASMEPGQACITCHARSGGEAPTFVVAGTLYPTGHEPDNCNGTNGTSSGAKVVVIGNNGNSITLTPNSVGNFYSSTSLPGPYKAKVVNSAGIERVMATAVSTGDCNSCHTQNGANSAPGRITLP
jgi:hypothetical protein